ncbi:hypothetical protein DNTS_022144 [Danionella cerebrum]|uniref:Shisa family member 6 n=1 Tax=Danionella cerebrum TaxID=2873325 RepID=A0A553R0N7_9TELE|nr:hypothetical protein DNTS_022144 [Danionella translucida]
MEKLVDGSKAARWGDVQLRRSRLKDNHPHDYTSHLDLTGSHTPKIGHRIEYYEETETEIIKESRSSICMSSVDPVLGLEEHLSLHVTFTKPHLPGLEALHIKQIPDLAAPHLKGTSGGMFLTSVLLGEPLPGTIFALIKQLSTHSDGCRGGLPTLSSCVSSRCLCVHSTEKPRMNNILTSQTEPYDLSFSRSFQNLTHLPPSYEMAMKADLVDKDDDYYIRKHHLPDPTPRSSNLQTHMIKLTVDPPAPRQKPKRVQRAMSQDHVLSPGRSKPTLTSYSGGLSPYHGRILSEEQLLSADRLHSQDPLLSPEKMHSLRRSNFREKAMSRALSQMDMFMPTTPVMDRHYKMMKMHSHPTTAVVSNNESYNTLTVNSAQAGNKRQAFANRRMHTVDHLQYIPGHHHHQYRTASKTEVTV